MIPLLANIIFFLLWAINYFWPHPWLPFAIAISAGVIAIYLIVDATKSS